MARSQEHAHKYRKITLGKKGTFVIMRCMLPKCTHHVPLKLAEGRETICWGCSKRFVLGPKNLRQEKPRCDNCVKKAALGPTFAARQVVEQDVPIPEIDEKLSEEAEQAEDEAIEHLIKKATIGKGVL